MHLIDSKEVIVDGSALMAVTSRAIPKGRNRTLKDLLNTKEVAEALGIKREAARILMTKTRGVVTLPAINGSGKRETRRMPRKVLDSLIVQRGRSKSEKPS